MRTSITTIGLVVLLIVVMSVASSGAVSLSDETMGRLVGGTPGGGGGYYCGGDNPCQHPSCDPFQGLSCTRCNGSGTAQGCLEALIGGASQCEDPMVPKGCGTVIPGAMCLNLECQGGDEEEASGDCARQSCNAHN